ncbi:hypothetical protein [Luteimonas terrae]|uniref:Uncharacterized protein n=1 Tax=Luteimonas terrae TaxID=1530191 RepID=A0A4R5U9L4_9GAMM|nr:hypothetical protein [Luteimonas terrae]TDK30962.1 hypothetical protein E2F49_11540 [Luteimonas terrae]
MNPSQQFILKVFKRYGVFVGFDVELDTVPRLPREAPATLAELRDLIIELTEADEVHVFMPVECGGKALVRKVKHNYSYFELDGLVEGLMREGKRSAKRKYTRLLDQQKDDHEVALMDVMDAKFDLEDQMEDLKEQLELKAQAHQRERQAMSAVEQKKVDAAMAELQKKLADLQFVYSDLSPETKARIEEDKKIAYAKRKQEVREQLCSCNGAHESCSRCGGKGTYKINGNDDIVG